MKLEVVISPVAIAFAPYRKIDPPLPASEEAFKLLALVLMLPPVLSRVILPALPVKVEVSRFPAAMSPNATRARSPPFEVMEPA
jgi:hypothetical protein